MVAIGFMVLLTVTHLVGITTPLHAEEPALQTRFRTLDGRHIRLKSDSDSEPLLKDCVAAFDAAVPQWAAFFQIPLERLQNWKVDAFLMENEQAFRDTGDLPGRFKFPYGYAIDGNLWAFRQQSDYYTRHLLLHEGVHALAIELYGGTGPSWFAEGLAEMLGVHTGTGKNVIVNQVPVSREAVPYWGRFKLIRRLQQAQRIPTLQQVLDYPADLKGDVESYGWSWAAMMLLTQYPEYRSEVLKACAAGSNTTASFTEQFKRSVARQRPIIDARWRLMCQTLDYGFDWSRERVDLSLQDPIWDGKPLTMRVDASRGWQSCGVRLSPGQSLTIRSSGTCVLDRAQKPWKSEPAGVTVEYANGRPLGQLLVAVVPNATGEQRQLAPMPIRAIETETVIRTKEHCWLVFRVNDHLAKRADNEGGYGVQVQRSP